MRLVVFFDLPVETAKQRKAYRLFRKGLIKDGFLMLQESVYVKLVVADAAATATIARLRKGHPPEGLVQVLKVTERQYEAMECIVGEKRKHDEIDSMEGLLVL